MLTENAEKIYLKNAFKRQSRIVCLVLERRKTRKSLDGNKLIFPIDR